MMSDQSQINQGEKNPNTLTGQADILKASPHVHDTMLYETTISLGFALKNSPCLLYLGQQLDP